MVNLCGKDHNMGGGVEGVLQFVGGNYSQPQRPCSWSKHGCFRPYKAPEIESCQYSLSYSVMKPAGFKTPKFRKLRSPA